MEKQMTDMEKIISLSKRRGFIFPGSDIYGGLAGTWDRGPFGVALAKNIQALWRKRFVENRTDMYEVDAAILMNPKVWETSGHVAGFTDPLVECTKCKRRFRPDQLPDATKCPECDGAFGPVRQFNMMFSTQIGAVEDSSATVYLRPETAQGIFTNYKNIIDSFHPKLPFGVAQIGKAFRNEITPRDFIFRVREMEQMEIEYFVSEEDWEKQFAYWKDEIVEFLQSLGIDMNRLHEIEIPEADRAHYSKRTVDFEFEFPFGQKELCGFAYRGSFDLDNIARATNTDLAYLDDATGEKSVPHVLEPSMGVERLLLAILLSSYREDAFKESEEPRVYLKLPPKLAPVICAVSPLLKNKPELVKYAEGVFTMLKERFGRVMWDDNGNIGKRYRRQDEIGTPYCIVIDFDTLEDNTITVRDRDSGTQERMPAARLVEYLQASLS